MKRLDLAALIFSGLSFFTAIIAGLFGQQLASYVALGIVAFLYIAWISIKLVNIEKKVDTIYDGESAKQTISVPNHRFFNKHKPKYEFMHDSPITIDQLDKRIIISAAFLEWPKYTILFWANISDDFLQSTSNRYLFAYTNNPAAPKEESLQYPNAFFSGIVNKSDKWRLIIKGPDPKNNKAINFVSTSDLKGWKLFAIRWSESNEKIEYSIDAGEVLREDRKLPPNNRPRNVPGHAFYLGGWCTAWKGGLSMLEFFRFRVFDTYLSDSELSKLFESEKNELEPVEV